jgi:hypothetical protein
MDIVCEICGCPGEADTGKRLVKLYLQPDAAEPCKPQDELGTPAGNVDKHTVYKLSYLPFDADVAAEARGIATAHGDNLGARKGLMSDDTTHRHDYREWPGAVPAQPIYQYSQELFGGQMRSQTTYKHDYRRNALSKTTPAKPHDNMGLPDGRMEDTSIMTASYQPVDSYESAESCKPHDTYRAPTTPFSTDTVYKLSYLPVETPEKEEYDWARREKYKSPTVPFDASSVYTNSFLPPGEYVYVESEGGDGDSRNVCPCCSDDEGY